MLNSSCTAPAAPQDPALLRDISALVSGWDPFRPVSDLIVALVDRSGLAAPAAPTRKKKRGKCMARRRGQKVKIEEHGGWRTFRARVDVEGQVKRIFKRFPVSPIDPADPRWLNASECYRKAVKMMGALEGKNEEVVGGEGKEGEVPVNRIDINPTGVVPVEVAPTKPSVPTFAEQAKIFMSQLGDDEGDECDSFAHDTRQGYLDNWLLPLLGDLPLNQITNSKVKTLVDWMKKGGPMPQERK